MGALGDALQRGADGFFLSLVTESFAVRAFLGSLAAAGLAAFVVHYDLVRSRRARRLLVLAPVLVAAAAGVASIRDAEAYLPQLWVPAEGGQPLVELFGELNVVAAPRGGVLVAVYAAVALLLLCRRSLGVLAVRRALRRARHAPADSPVATAALRLSASMRIRAPRVVLLAQCPGGAFTAGTLRPVVAVDPALLSQLDDRELEGLVAHELAHVARRDALLCLLVGAFRDLTFFLPPLHLATRWLGREREESADELASSHTRRPAALASSILKVWDASRRNGQLQMACAAVGAAALAPRRFAFSRGDTAGQIAARVERLIALPPAASLLRRLAECTLAAGIAALGTAAAVLVPTWIATDLNAEIVSFGYLGAPAAPVESPAFATFRALAPEADHTDVRGEHEQLRPAAEAGASALGCPCVESQSQLQRGEAARTAPETSHMRWSDGVRPAYSLTPSLSAARAERGRRWALSDGEVGFFVTGPAQR